MFPEWTNMLTPGQWVVLLMVPPLITALYFLKLKRVPEEVASTYLWKKSTEDIHVNSLIQKLKKNILLFLQLIVILLAIISAFRPTWRGTELVGDRFIFLIDNSASMQTKEEGKSRLDVAKKQVEDLMDSMPDAAPGMLITFSDNASIQQIYTNNKIELKQRLNLIEPTNRMTSIDEALQAASGLANPGSTSFDKGDKQVAEARPANMYVLSDGNFLNPHEFDMGNLNTEFHPIGSAEAKNVGILAFDIERSDLAENTVQLQSFARVHNFNDETEDDAEVNISLYVSMTSPEELTKESSLVDSQTVTIPSGKSENVIFNLPADFDTGVLRLEIDYKDDTFDLDNQAWTVLNPYHAGRVLVITDGNTPIETGFDTKKIKSMAEIAYENTDILESEKYQNEMSLGQYHLIIFDDCAPKKIPLSNTLFINSLPPEGGWSANAEPGIGPQVLDVDRSHPITTLVNMSDVRILKGLSNLQGPPGSSTLINSQYGSLLSVAERTGFHDVVLGFPVGKTNGVWATDWQLKTSFPVFLLNTLQFLGGGHDPLADALVKPGDIVTLHSPVAQGAIKVIDPEGETHEVTPTSPSTYDLTFTEKLGLYEVKWEGQANQYFAVNLFDSLESGIATKENVEFGSIEVDASEEYETAKKQGWKILIILALLVLLAEWVIYNQRVS